MKKALSIFLTALLIISAIPSVAQSGASLMATVNDPVITVSDVINGVSVKMSCSTSSATIYYTLDGSTPTTDSSIYGGEFVIDTVGSYKLRAIAYKSGSESAVVSKDFSLLTCGYLPSDGDLKKVITIAYISEGSHKGEYIVNFNIPSDYTVYYTTGTSKSPSVSSNNAAEKELYIKKPTIINILACRKGYAPERVSIKASHPSWAGIPTVEKITGKRNISYGKVEIELSTKTEGAQIYYKFDTNAIPDEVTAANGIKYTGPIVFEQANVYVINAVAVKEGYFDSDQYQEKATVLKMADPKISVSSKDTNGRRTVTVTADADSDIFYTTDGTDPTPLSNKYTGPITYGKSLTFKAIAAKMGYVSSNVISAAVSATGGDIVTVESPSVASKESVSGVKTITLTPVTPDSEIYYNITDTSVNSYTVTVNDELYTKPIVFKQSGSYKIWLRAYKNGVYSAVSSVTVNVSVEDGGRPAVSYVTLENGIRAVSLASDEGNEIYYIISDEMLDTVSLDEATLYTYPITVNRPMYINAVAVTPEGSISEIRHIVASSSTFPNGEVTPSKVSGTITMNSAISGAAMNVVLDCSDTAADLFYSFDNDPSAEATTADTPYVKGSTISFHSNGYLHVAAARPGYISTVRTFSIGLDRAKTAAPTLTASVNAGTGKYVVQMESSTPNAVYYYTTDGSVPTENSTQAIAGFALNISAGVTFKAIAVADGFEPSDVVTKVLTDGITPTCSGIISEEVNIIGGKALRLASLTDGATIYYTTNGTDPTTDSLVYNDKDRIRITTPGETTVRAIAVKNGYLDSDVYSFTVNVLKLNKPTGAYAQSGDLKIKLSATSNDENGEPIPNISIYYTLDYDLDKEDPAPDPQPGSSLLYTSVFSVDKTVIVRAIAVKEGYATSDVYMGTMKYELSRVEIPSGPAAELCMGGKLFPLSCATEGASIYYNTDGSNNYTLYTGPIECNEPIVYVYCFARKSGMNDSMRARYTIRSDKAPTPTANIPTNSVIPAGSKITLSADKYTYPVTGAEYDSVIYYTLDGSTPTRNSTLYTGPITLDGETRIRAVAISTGAVESDILELYYSIDSQQSYGISVDVSGLRRENNVVKGGVTLTVNGIECTDCRVMAAIYKDNELLQVISADAVENGSVDINGFDVLLDGNESVAVKAFVLNKDSLSPICKNTVAIY